MKKISLILILLSLSIGLKALPLPSDHFLAPRDYEPLWLVGIESPISFRGLIRNLNECDKERTYQSDFRNFHCSLKEDVIETTLYPEFNDQNFGTITFFGETHYNQKGQLYLAEVINKSPKGFFTTLGLEMINEWGQEEIDHLVETGAPLESWKALFDKHWNYDAEGYLKIIEAALDKGIKIIALDDRRKERNETHLDNFSEDLIYRDEVMAKNLVNHLLDNPKARIVTLMGKLHSFNKLSEQRITIAEVIKDSIPNLKSKHYMLATIKKATLFRSLAPHKALPYRLKAQNGLEDFANFHLFF